MSGIDDLFAESDDRWGRAARSAEGLADNGMGKALHSYYALYFPLGVLALVAVGAGAAGLVFGSATAHSALLTLRFGLLLAAFGGIAGGLLYNAKKVRPAANLGNGNVLRLLDGQQQKHIRRQILGKRPVEVQHRTVARGAAVQLRKSLATQLLIMPMLPLVFSTQVFPGTSDVWPLFALIICGYVIGVAFLIRDFRRMGRFLRRTNNEPAPPASEDRDGTGQRSG
jgi:hypothetical protein